MSVILADAPSTTAGQGFGIPGLDASSTITFPEGLPGFPQYREFVLVESPVSGLAWLQSVEQEHLALLVALPEVVCAESAELMDSFRKKRLFTAVVITLPGVDRPAATANLKAPVVIDPESRVARQVILPDSRFSVTHPFDLQALLAAA